MKSSTVWENDSNEEDQFVLSSAKRVSRETPIIKDVLERDDNDDNDDDEDNDDNDDNEEEEEEERRMMSESIRRVWSKISSQSIC